ncbi:MAG TPA: GNAT family N-acetyltransferase [Burkholderiaceae bacterium]
MKLTEKARALGAKLAERNSTRKRLRGPAHLRYAVADSIAMLDRDAWQQATDRSGLFLSLTYLSGIERALPANVAPRYALIYDEDQGERTVLAAVYMQIVDIKLAQARPAEGSRGRLGASLDKMAQKTSQRVLVCGNMLSYGLHGVSFAENADEKLVWHGVAEVLYRVRQAEKLLGKTHFIMIKDLHEPHTKAAQHLTNLSYRYVETDPNMVLALRDEWKTHDDYLASLAAKYRSSIKNAVFKPIAEAGCTLEPAGDLEPVKERLHELYKMVQANAAFRPFELQSDYFPTLQRAAGEHFRCTLLKRGDSILGFLVSVADGDTAVAYHIGFDRAAAGELPLYLRLLHAGIADALELGCKRISLGRTALEPKAAIGAKPQTFGILLRHRQPVLNKLIKNLLLGVEHQDAPERNPFKKG